MEDKKDKKDKSLLNYVKGYTIPKKEPKYEDMHVVVPLPSNKLNQKKDEKPTKKKSSKLHRIPGHKKEDNKYSNKYIRKQNKPIDYDELIKNLEAKNKYLTDQIQRRENNIIKCKKKYEDQQNIIKNLELILSEQIEQKNKKNSSNNSKNEINVNNNKYLNDIDFINEILASEIESQSLENFEDNDLLYDDDFQEQIAINQVDQQIMDELYPNPDSMSYEQLLQLEDNMGNVNKGLSKKQIENLPNVYYDKDKYSENYQCIICMEEFEKKEKVKLLPCGHIFHDNCIKEWLLKQKSCPFCKSEIG